MSMSGQQGTHAPPWRTSASLALAIPLAFAGYHSVLRENDWWFAIALTSTLVLASAAITREFVPESRRTMRASLPSLIAAGVAAIVVSVGSAATTTLLGLPTPSTFRALAGLSGEGMASLAAQQAPALADPGVILLFTTGAAFVAVLADLWAVTLRTPALTGLVLVPTAVAPALIVPVDDYVWIALAVGAWLLVLVAQRPGRGRRAWDVAAVLGGAVATAVVVTMVVPSPSAGGTAGPGSAGSIRAGVNPVVTLGEDLRREETVTALHYSTESGEGHYLRLTSVDRFTDAGWEGDPSTDADSDAGIAPAPPGLSDAVARETEVTTVSVSALGGSWVPLPYPPAGVDGFGGFAEWDSELTALRLNGRSVRGADYSVSSLVLAPTPQQLQDAGSVVPEGLAEFATAEETWPAVIAETAASVTAGTTTSYERALALQEYLRAGPFEYSELAPERDGYDDTSAGAVAAFLDAKSGYCVQFASAMAVMARTLGIPSRIALGFLPGEEVDGADDDEHQRRVTSDELHAWPELYFEGVGWVPFEPTTSRGDPAVYAESDALQDLDVATPELPEVATPLPSPSASGAPERGDVGGLDLQETEEDAGVPPIAIVLMVFLALGLLPAVAREIVRVRRLGLVRRGRAGAELAWRELMESARDLDLPVTATATARTNAATIAATVRVPDTHLDAALAAVEGEAYTPPGRTAETDATPSVRAVLRRLRRAIPLRRRIAAVLWPRTLVERIVGAVS